MGSKVLVGRWIVVRQEWMIKVEDILENHQN